MKKTFKTLEVGDKLYNVSYVSNAPYWKKDILTCIRKSEHAQGIQFVFKNDETDVNLSIFFNNCDIDNSTYSVDRLCKYFIDRKEADKFYYNNIKTPKQ